MVAKVLHEEDVPDWTQGKCGGSRTDAFFPERLSAQVTALRAKQVCRGEDGRPPCPIIQECLNYAIKINEKNGVWGGMSERDRYKEVKRRTAARLEDEQIRAERRARRVAAAQKAWETRRASAASATRKRGAKSA